MRKDILERKDDILQWISEHQPKAYMCQQLKCKPETLERYLGLMDIEYKGNPGLAGFKLMRKNYIPAEQYIQGNNVSSSVLRDKLIRENIKEEKCERCGLTHWLDEKLSLELHHMDGNHFNNSFDNLQILCPNCHSLTSNYRNKGTQLVKSYNTDTEYKQKEKTNFCICCGIGITDKAKYCTECWHASQRKVERPSREVLKDEIRNVPFLQLGNKYGVSNKAIVKWCIAYNLPHKKQDIKTYSDEEWELI